MDWNLRTCGSHGHETYAPDERELAERLTVATPAGEAWRCLRCAAYVVGAPKGRGPADDAPEVPRGRLLRDRTIMRLLAIERALRGVGLLALGLAILYFRNRESTLKASFDNDLPLLKPLADQIGWNINDSKLVRGLSEVFRLSPTTLIWISVGVFAYAMVQFIEGVGLWGMKRWGEYFAVVATSVFLPVEIYELIEKVTALRIVLLIINVAAVLWLLWSKRLFGLRGGGAAYHREHSAESLLTVERAAVYEETAAPAPTLSRR